MRIKPIIGILSLIFIILLSLVFFTFFKHHPSPSHAPIPTQQLNQDNKKVEDFYQQLLKNKPEVSSKLQLLEHKVNAKQAFDNKDWYSARNSFMRVIAENPQDFQAWVFFIQSLKNN